MYRVTQYVIYPKDELYDYCCRMAKLANNMYNTSLFYIRQVMTAMTKLDKKEHLHENEITILKEIEDALPSMNRSRRNDNLFVMPTTKNKILSYQFLNALFKTTKNRDYMSELSRQTAQNMIKIATQDIKKFFLSLRTYKQNPDGFTGKPRIPSYKKSGGSCTFELTNQDITFRDGKLNFPKTKASFIVGDSIHGKIKVVHIKPYYNNFLLCITYDDGNSFNKEYVDPERIIAIDFGINNIAAIANNVGLPGLLFKGGIVKAENQWFNKKRASIMHGLMVGKTNPNQFTCHSLEKISMHRNGLIKTYLHTISNQIVQWSVDNQIDTIVLGYNKYWKKKINIGSSNNQNFTSIPFGQLKHYLHYKGERCGIRVIEQEESYTSKASFLDADQIPVYNDNIEYCKFSGRRISRGLYRSQNGTIVNADLNGAGNILRKACPKAFESSTSYKFLTEFKTM